MSDLQSQIRPEDCPAVLIHAHAASQCRLKPGHDGQHDSTCWSCDTNGEDSVMRWEDPANGITRWVDYGGNGHLEHG